MNTPALEILYWCSQIALALERIPFMLKHIRHE